MKEWKNKLNERKNKMRISKHNSEGRIEGTFRDNY